MPQPNLILISPDGAVRDRLHKSLADAGFTRRAHVLHSHPARADLERRWSSGDPPDAVFVDLSCEEDGLRTLETVKKKFPTTLTIAANGSRRLSTVVRARQAGAWGYLADPYDMRPLAEHFGVASDLRKTSEPSAPERGVVISFVPAKGGVGASTVAMHVAVAMAEDLDGETLLADLDFHTGIVAFQFGLSPQRTVADTLAGGHPAADAERWRSLDILAAPPSAEEAAALSDSLQNVLEAARAKYRAVVLDQPAFLSASARKTAAFADRVYLVCTAEITALHLARAKMEMLRRLGVEDNVRLLLNRVGAWGGLTKDRIERIVGAPVDWVLDNDYPSVRQAVWQGGLIAPDTALGGQLRQLGCQIVEDLDLHRRLAAVS